MIRGRPRRLTVLIGALLLAAACERVPHKAEVLTDGRDEKAVLKVAASDETHHLFRRIAETYSSRHGVQFEVTQTQSGNILELLKSGVVDIGVTSRSLAAEGKKSGLNYIPFAFDGAVFLAASDAKVGAISAAQLRAILEGRITNWKEVGGADSRINVITRPPYSSVTLAIEESLFGGRFPKAKNEFRLETTESAYQALKSLHSYIAYAPISRTMVEPYPAVALTIDGQPPLIAHIPERSYPARLEYGILLPKNAPEHAAEFAAHLVSVEGMHALASMALTPAARRMPLSSCHCRETEGAFDPSGRQELAGVLSIAVVPELGAIEQEKRYSGICRLIAEGLGVRTQLRHLPSYGDVVREFEERRIDAAFVGSLMYGHLRERFGVVPVARPEAGGVSHYRGVVIVRADRGIRAFADLKGRTFAYVPQTSAGEAYTKTLVGGGDAAVDAYFSGVVPVSSHSEAVNLVLKGKVDGAAVKDLVLKRLIAGSPGMEGKLKIIGASPRFPENGLVVSPLIEEKQRKRLLEILLACGGKESERRALAALGATRFIPTSHEDYAGMYSIAGSAGIRFREKR